MIGKDLYMLDQRIKRIIEVIERIDRDEITLEIRGLENHDYGEGPLYRSFQNDDFYWEESEDWYVIFRGTDQISQLVPTKHNMTKIGLYDRHEQGETLDSYLIRKNDNEDFRDKTLQFVMKVNKEYKGDDVTFDPIGLKVTIILNRGMSLGK